MVDSHFPWLLSGFRYHEAEEFLRRRPDTLFFSLFRLTDPFPTAVHSLASFPTVAPAAGVTDIHLVFLNWAAGVLGVEGEPEFPSVPGARADVSLSEPLERWGILAHSTLYPGGGLFPDTDASVIAEVAQRSANVFTTVPRVADIVPDAIPTSVPVPARFYWHEPREEAGDLRLVFVADDRPRKGLKTLLDAIPQLGTGFHLDVVGPHERHETRLKAAGAELHGWLSPARLREVLWTSDVIVAPATRDLAEDGYGDTGLVDGFPTTAARVAMVAGCCLVGSNPTSDYSMLKPGIDYVEVPERDPDALASTILALRADPARRRRVACHGAESIRLHCDVSAVVALKLERMGCA